MVNFSFEKWAIGRLVLTEDNKHLVRTGEWFTLNIVKRSWNDSNSASSFVQENSNSYDFCSLHKKNDAGGNRYNVYNQLI